MNLRTAMRRFKSFYKDRRPKRKQKHILADKYARVNRRKRQSEVKDKAWRDRPFSRQRRPSEPTKKKKKVDSFRRPTKGWFD